MWPISSRRSKNTFSRRVPATWSSYGSTDRQLKLMFGNDGWLTAVIRPRFCCSSIDTKSDAETCEISCSSRYCQPTNQPTKTCNFLRYKPRHFLGHNNNQQQEILDKAKDSNKNISNKTEISDKIDKHTFRNFWRYFRKFSIVVW